MANMRVHELAKEFGMTSKELLEHLNELKIPAKNHASTLVEAYVDKIRKDLAPIIEEKQAELEAKRKKEEEKERKKREAEETAKGDAAKIVEQGQATAKVLKDLAATYNRSGTSGRDVLLMQKLVPLLKQLSGTIGDLRVDRLTVLPGTGNGAGGDGASSLAGRLVSYGEQIKAATGIDVTQVLLALRQTLDAAVDDEAELGEILLQPVYPGIVQRGNLPVLLRRQAL